MQSEFDSEAITPSEVRRIFRWAKRRGSPAWLWPDVTVEAWRAALRRIEEVTRGALTGAPTPVLEGEPTAIGLACYTSGLGPLLGWWRGEGVISANPAVVDVLERHLRQNRLRVSRMAEGARSVVEALVDSDIAVAVLKGAHTAPGYFPDPATRPASDVDILLAAEKALEAEAVMQSRGFEIEGRGPRESSWRAAGAARTPRSLTHVHADDPWSVDLHSSLDVFVSAGAPLARLDVADPLASRVPWPPCPGAVVLDQPLLLLHLAVHAGSGLQNLTMLRLVELVFVIRQDAATGRLSWPAFVEMGKDTASLVYAYPALRLCEMLAPGLVPADVLEACARQAPEAVLRVVAQLTPATAQRIDGVSMAEHFMWTRGVGGWLRQLAWDVAPSTSSWRELGEIYEKRAWRLINGAFSR